MNYSSQNNDLTYIYVYIIDSLRQKKHLQARMNNNNNQFNSTQIRLFEKHKISNAQYCQENCCWTQKQNHLTYITPQIIAMAFPASGIQKTYRNSIHDVSRFLTLKHGPEHYLIINASNRKYNYAPFHNQVLQFFWTDHQAPPITTLFQLCSQVHSFLQQSKKNVVAVHCNHGKGRTGTAIISYLLFSGRFHDVESALKFYNKKRFRGAKYSVDQPCQLRYLNYFKSFLQLPINYLSQHLKAYKIVRASHSGPKDRELMFRISQTRTQHLIYPQTQINGQKIKFSRPLIGDIFIQVLQSSWSGKKQLISINYNLFFLVKNADTNTYEARFIGQEIKMSRLKQGFELILEFEEFCHCDKAPKQQCMCYSKREREQSYWDEMLTIIAQNKKSINNKEVIEDKDDNPIEIDYIDQMQDNHDNQDIYQQQQHQKLQRSNEM